MAKAHRTGFQIQKLLAKYRRENYENVVSVAEVKEYAEMNGYEMSEKTIRRVLKELELEGLLLPSEKGVQCYVIDAELMPQAGESEVYDNAEDLL